jgi:hypothetical protein
MATGDSESAPPTHLVLRILARKNVLTGLMFIAIAAFGLWASRNYPVGTALRMSTGYVPRLLCWLLMGLGAIVLVQGLRERAAPEASHGSSGISALAQIRPVAAVTLSLIVFALALEPLGLVLSIVLLVAIARFASRDLGVRETFAAAAGLSVLTWAIFVLGLGLTIPVWPDW